MTIQELAQQYADLFVTKTRRDGEKYICVENNDKSPELMDLIRTAHDGMFPDDYKYQFIHEALEAIAESADEEYIDLMLEPDIYNHDLLKWVSSNLTRASYVDQAVMDGYQYDGLLNTLINGQSYEKNEVLHSVIASLNEIIKGME